MAERERRPADPDLERALIDLGPRLAYPPTPDLAPAVRARLAAHPHARRPPRRGFFTPRWGLALAAVFVLLAGIPLVVSPSARTAVAERLGLRGVKITYVPTAPAPTPASPTGAPVPVEVHLGLGEPLTLAEAPARVPYRVLLPSLPDLGPPDQVFVTQVVPGGQVALVYRPRPGIPDTTEAGVRPRPGLPGTGVGILLTQFRGDFAPEFLGKGIGPGTRLEQVTVNGAPGYWIEGQPHALFYRDANGEIHDDRVRLAGNTLLWEQDGLTLRLESALTREEALRIAESVR